MSSSLNLWSGNKNYQHTKAITPKVGKPELWFMWSACRLMVFKVCVKFHENMSSGLKIYEADMKTGNTQRPITPKATKPELPFMRFVCCFLVFNIFVKFQCSAVLNLWSGHKKLLTHKGQ